MKKILLMAATLMSALVLRAEGDTGDNYLYWMFDADEGLDFTYATIWAVTKDHENWEMLTVDRKVGDEWVKVDVIIGGENKPSYSNLSDVLADADLDNLGFLVEVWADDATWSTVGQSDWVSYRDLYNTGFIYHDMGTAGIAAPYLFTPHAIPEPCGGTLVMLGLAALALRRRRMRS